ncbi:hypothetical protein ABZV78_19815, partial [Micromonospora sp. NPDC004540]|uniref:hypothetical protein n=1 Tax=Micromonospora sp. NPDC004540 TaxID=3154457 RepID=UPI0033A616B3
MAFRTWGRLLLTALGVSVLAGAGQLGIAYGFGVVRLDGAFVDDSVNRWPAQLAWVGWFAAVATVVGAVLTERLTRRGASPAGTTELLSIAGLSAVGAIVVAPLCMQPARATELGGTVDPVWAVGICAILGAVVGAGTAIAVLLKPPFGWNIVLTAAAVWLLALVSVAPSVASTGSLPTVRLGVLEPSWLDPAAAQRLAMLLLPTVALLAGAAVGVLARRAGYLPLVGGAAGAAGPVLLAFAYLTAGPGTAVDHYQLAPYYGALIAVAAGALGSTATTVLPRPVTTAAGPDAVEPTDILQPLPPSPATSGPAPTGTVTAHAVGAPSPAHWDWPEAGGLTPAPVPAGLTRRPLGRPAAGPPAARTEPVYGSGPADEREARTEPVYGPTPTDEREATGPGRIRHRFDAPAPVAEAPSAGAGDPTRDAGRVDELAAADPPARPGQLDEVTRPRLDAPAGPPPGAAAEATSDRDRFDPPTASGVSLGQGSDPARSDWPSEDAGTDQPVPGPTRPGRAADDNRTDQPEPDTQPAWAFGDPVPDEPTTGWDDGELTRNLPMPGSLPPGRRTSAIDVLSAGRPTPPAEPDPVTPPVPTTEPAHPTTEPAHPTAPRAEVTRLADRSKAPSVAPHRTEAPVQASPTERAMAEREVAEREVAEREVAEPAVAERAVAERAVAERAVAEAAPAAPATKAAPARSTRSRRSRAAQPADGVPPAGEPAAAAAGEPAAEAAAEAGGRTPAAPAPAGRAKRTRKPRTSRTAPDRSPAEPATTTSDSTVETTTTSPDSTTRPDGTTKPDSTAKPTTTKPDSTAKPAATTRDRTAEPAGSTPDRSFEPGGSTPDRTFEPAGSTSDRSFASAERAPAAEAATAAPAGATASTVEAVQFLNLPVVMATVLLAAVFIVVANIV